MPKITEIRGGEAGAEAFGGESGEKSEKRSRDWLKIADALGDLWDIAERFPEEKLKGYKGAEFVMQQLRIKSQMSFDAIHSQLELAGKDPGEINHLIQDVIAIAQGHQREYFIHQLTNPTVASGKAEKIYRVFSEGFSAKGRLEHRDEPQKHREAA